MAFTSSSITFCHSAQAYYFSGFRERCQRDKTSVQLYHPGWIVCLRSDEHEDGNINNHRHQPEQLRCLIVIRLAKIQITLNQDKYG